MKVELRPYQCTECSSRFWVDCDDSDYPTICPFCGEKPHFMKFANTNHIIQEEKTMREVTLGTLMPGDSFAVAGHKFVVLTKSQEEVLCISHKFVKTMAFGASNDWRNSAIKGYLNGEFLESLVENGLDEDMIIPINIDLKATNGGREYGYDTCEIGLLTLEQYIRYAEYIPLADNWWWLATPWGTPNDRSPSINGSAVAWLVNTDGNGSSDSSSLALGIRPALVLSSSLLVSPITDNKADVWAEYLEYLVDWTDCNSDIGHYGTTPDDFDEWYERNHPEEDE